MKRPSNILIIGAVSAPIYLALALFGDLRPHWPWFYTAYLLLTALMLAAFLSIRRKSFPTRSVLLFALLFRLLAPLGDPSLSDDVYRYVWDGRVQIHGTHPYRHAPEASELAGLRDGNWERINHREVGTIYPPLAQLLFGALSSVGCGPLGFRMVIGLLDFIVVLLLAGLLRRLRAPPERILFYAWNPLAILEAAGSGHLDSAGVLCVLLALVSLHDRKPTRAAVAWVCGVMIKLLPLIWALSFVRRLRTRHVAIGLTAAALLVMPYALTGPIVPSGTMAFAEQWERNGPIFSALLPTFEALDLAPTLKGWIAAAQERVGERLDLTALYYRVWPQDLTRLTLLLAGVIWILFCVRRRYGSLEDELFFILTGVLLLQPTLHPWYLLWLLPFAAVRANAVALLWVALVPLAYLGGEQPMSTSLMALEYIPPLAVALWLRFRPVTMPAR